MIVLLVIPIFVVLSLGFLLMAASSKPDPHELWKIQSRLWFEKRDPKTLPEYNPRCASTLYDEAMRDYGDAKYMDSCTDAHWKAVHAAIENAYEELHKQLS